MSRPQKSRIVYTMPTCEGFIPIGYSHKNNGITIILSIDEYEVLRLIDLSGFSQEECAKSMSISRPTVTNIYEKARFKVADALINEKTLLVQGGNYDICQQNKKIGKLEKENNNMNIAVTYENGEIFQHFGHCQNFKVYKIEDNKIVSSKVIDASESGHSALAGFLKELNVETLICGGIGGGAKVALANQGIRLFGGVSGNADQAVEKLINGTLEYNADVQCSHHGEGHTCGHGHGEGHTCGHGHGEGHTCGQ